MSNEDDRRAEIRDLNDQLLDAVAEVRTLRNVLASYKEASVAGELAAELARAREIHPKNMNSAHEGYAVILEELDELWDEVKRNPGSDLEARRKRIRLMRKECVQVGAMCVRFIEDVCDKET